jgi:hypothetical protein
VREQSGEMSTAAKFRNYQPRMPLNDQNETSKVRKQAALNSLVNTGRGNLEFIPIVWKFFFDGVKLRKEVRATAYDFE